MENICIVNCSEDIPARYDIGQCKPVFRKHGYSQFVAFKCGIEFLDILDPTEWEAKIASGDIVLSPEFGTFVLGETTSSVIPGGCGESYPEFSETPWTFTTPSTSEDYADEDFWYFFNQSANGYTMGYLNCDDRLYLNDTTIKAIKVAQAETVIPAVPLSDPGLQISLTGMPNWSEGPNGVGKAGIWKVDGNFIHSDVLRSVEIPGLSDALESETPPV